MSSEEIPLEVKPEQKIKLLLSYDGTDFCGWQRQINQPSIQESLETALEKVFKRKTVIVGSGRTDSGVHAEGQVAHFITNYDLKKINIAKALQKELPRSISIIGVWLAPMQFEALRSVEKKTYIYRILNRKYPCALRHRYTCWWDYPLDLKYLQELADQLIGTHDFKSFQNTGTDVETTTRTIFEAKWLKKEDIVEFHITGSGFLKQMVRNLVGTMLEMHKNRDPVNKMTEILNACDRNKAGMAAEPQGLYLSRVFYPENLDNKCQEL